MAGGADLLVVFDGDPPEEAPDLLGSGVRSADDVRQYLRAGASLVGIGTAALADPRLPERIIRDLERGDG